jgi:hypothetical protein
VQMLVAGLFYRYLQRHTTSYQSLPANPVGPA